MLWVQVIESWMTQEALLICCHARNYVIFLLDCVLARWSFPHERKVCCSLFAMVIMNASSPLI